MNWPCTHANRPRRLSALIAVLVLTVAIPNAAAQSGIASITGIVNDPSGAPVMNCEIALTNVATGIVSKARTNQSGVYILPSLVAGPYTATFESPGFSKREIRGLDLRTGQQLRLDALLEVGAVAESVQVSAVGEPLMKETVEMSQTLTSSDIQNLPLNGRNPYAMVQFAAGISAGGNDPSALDYADRLSINGSRSRGNAFVIDGSSSLHIGGIGERIGSIEAFSEAKILTHTYSAEYGRTAGGVLVFNVKNGGNQHHGSVYEYHRNNSFNATNWQDNANNRAGVTRRIHEFGGTWGGPVPGTKDKMFFFGSYEGQRDRNPTTRLRTIPEPAVRSGNFSALPTVVNDPLGRTPFPNNTIPVNRQDPAAVNFLKLFPAPNSAGTFNAQFRIPTNNWVYPGKVDWDRNFGIGRIDYNPTDRDRFFVTFAHINEARDEGLNFDSAINNIRGATPRDMRRLSINYTRIFSPNLSNEVLAHAMRDNRKQYPWFGDFSAQQTLGIRRTPTSGMPTINIAGGYGAYGHTEVQDWINQPAGLNNTLTWQSGKHTMRFGGQYFQNQFWYISTGQVAGSYTFLGEVTGLGAPGRNNPLNALGDFLLGAVKTSTIPVPQIPVNRMNYNLGLFLNDTFKVSRNLTLNLGLRYESETRQLIKNNVYSRVDLTSGALLVAGRNASQNLNLENDRFNLAPRVGVAYALGDKTVIRTGLAVFHSNFWMDNGEMVSYPGFTGSRSFVDPGIGLAQPFRLSDGTPTEGLEALTDPFVEVARATANLPLTVGAVSYSANTTKLPRITQWNVGLQRSLPLNTVVEVAYVASRSSRQPRTIAANNPGLEQSEAVNVRRVRLQDVRPFPIYTGFNAVRYDARADYHSLQVNVTRRFSAGFSVDGSFTFSKNTDTASGFSDSFQIPWQYPEIEHARSSLDRPRSFTLGWVWELPFGKGRRFVNANRVASAILGGFQLNGIFSASDGVPLTITQQNANLLLQVQRPNVKNPANLSGKVDSPSFEGPARRWLIATTDPGFPFEASGNLGIGNLGRNTTREPGFVNFNLSAFRNFEITERVRIQFRAEAYNAMNHVNYLEPASTSISAANYGLITNAAPARQIQLGLRLSF
ncbi:MAG: TonB-dependent receptor [Acidobacteria bacterium]|nr:TonB-dependent receptor [Acidobacteriota bacterium]